MNPQIKMQQNFELVSMLIVALEKIQWDNAIYKQELETKLYSLITNLYNETNAPKSNNDNDDDDSDNGTQMVTYEQDL